METETPPCESRLRDPSDAYQAEPEQPPSEAVLAAIASATELDTLELADEFGPLYDVIDPSALDSLFRSTAEREQSVGCVTFEYAGYRIAVDRTGRIELADAL
ncbi:HalOD1 output domain-containing protein [Natrinema salaciae]|uniref:Halobacterial output domain-containing protein n=1 Tax=Natrinema salaciae TaxID=1186196 RepID=A0A1H9CYZ7_9EURY|nr:HalOD1 output domain-containing protein [Natrinema salaciae]SEQ06425.1 hypothetical protein SAMN04489841_1199 [Natrinema salaciae]